MACDFPVQMASNADNVSIWWRHHDLENWIIIGLGHVWWACSAPKQASFQWRYQCSPCMRWISALNQICGNCFHLVIMDVFPSLILNNLIRVHVASMSLRTSPQFKYEGQMVWIIASDSSHLNTLYRIIKNTITYPTIYTVVGAFCLYTIFY